MLTKLTNLKKDSCIFFSAVKQICWVTDRWQRPFQRFTFCIITFRLRYDCAFRNIHLFKYIFLIIDLFNYLLSNNIRFYVSTGIMSESNLIKWKEPDNHISISATHDNHNEHGTTKNILIRVRDFIGSVQKCMHIECLNTSLSCDVVAAFKNKRTCVELI